MERGVYFDAWFPRQHCYHPSLPPRRLRMIEDLEAYHATSLVWSALGGGSISLPYLEEEAWGEVDPRFRFYGFLNDAEFIQHCQERGIKVFGCVFEVQGWEFPVELDEDESKVLSMNETRGVGKKAGSASASSRRTPTRRSGSRSRTTSRTASSTATARRSPTSSRSAPPGTSTVCRATRRGSRFPRTSTTRT